MKTLLQPLVFPVAWLLLAVTSLYGSRGFAQDVSIHRDALQALKTVAETSQFTATSTEAEVQLFLKQCVAAVPSIRLDSIGVTNEGRPLHAILLGRPASGERSLTLPLPAGDSRVVVVVIANIHSGECDGKEAMLALIRDVLLDMPKAWSDKLVIAIIPNFNADGNERVGLAHRPGQVGPEKGMGVRENAQNLDLNRDFIKLQTPEVRSLVRAIDTWKADVLIDCHTTNGSLHRYPLTYDIPHNPAGSTSMLAWLRRDFLPTITQRLKQQGLETFYYGNFDGEHKKWETYGHEPRYSTEYMGMRGRIGILSESYSYATYQERIDASYRFVRACLDLLAEESQQVRALVEEADRRLMGGTSGSVPLNCEPIPSEPKVDLLGYAFPEGFETKGRKFPSPADKHRVAELRPVTYPATLWNEFRPKLQTVSPEGYLLPPQLAWAIERLMLHGVRVDYFEDLKDLDPKAVHSWKVQQVISQPFQGLALTKVQVEADQAPVSLEGPWYYVTTRQPLGSMICYLLEPESDENLATWGFLDGYLSEGQAYPIYRYEGTWDAARGKPVNEPPRSEPLSLETLFKPGQTIALTNPTIPEPRWLATEESYLVERGGSWTAIDAATGAMRPWDVAKSCMEAMGTLEPFKSPVDRRSAFRIESFLPDYSKAIWEWKHDWYVYDHANRQVKALTQTPDVIEQFAELSPDGKLVAYVIDNNLYVQDVESLKVRQVTDNGNADKLNGILDWVYQEEIYGRGKFKAFWWSPDGKHLAFLELDQRPVPTYQVTDSISIAQKLESTRYPMSGAPNPEAKLWIWHTESDQRNDVQFEQPADDRLVCRVDWHPDSQRLCVQVQNRIQTWLDLLECDAQSGQTNRLFREQGSAWIDVTGSPKWLPNGDFLWLSDLPGGRRHLFRVRGDGKQRTALTAGNWDVSELLSVSLDGKSAWLLGNPSHPSQVQGIRASTENAQWEQVTKEEGSHRLVIHPKGTFYADVFSAIDQPPRLSIHDSQGKLLRVTNTATVDRHRAFRVSPPKFFTLTARDGQTLQSMLIAPPGVDLEKPDRRYPVVIHVYGGPRHPTIKQAWQSTNYWWHQYLAQQGMFVLLCDNRSALGAGNHDAWKIYKDLGQVELRDLEDAVGWLGKQLWADIERVGLWGWSYGGYLTGYAMTHSKLFRAGISGAPVTDWRNYDSIYTERFMSTPEANPSGYIRSSVVEAANQLHGRLLLIHGEIDENVHIANTLQLAHALQKAGKPFELMVYPLNRHGVTDPQQRFHLQQTMTEFFLRNLRDAK